jgi:signal transduction histidine kinase
MPQEGDHQEKISANPRTNPIVTPTLQHSLVPGLTKIQADRIQLQQVVLTLMMNGMGAVAETTERPRELLISAREKDSELIVRVEDSGMGLDAEIVQKIFNPFSRPSPTALAWACRSVARLFSTPKRDHSRHDAVPAS